jgi:hypothetical protein
MAILPVTAPLGTVAFTCVSLTTVTVVAFTPPKVTFVVCLRLTPVMVTTVPTELIGAKPVIYGITTACLMPWPTSAENFFAWPTTRLVTSTSLR